MTMLFAQAAKEFCEKISVKEVNAITRTLQDAEDFENFMKEEERKEKEEQRLLSEKKKNVTDVIRSFYKATVVSRYEDSVEELEDPDQYRRPLRQLDFKSIMQESFFWGPNKYGNNAIA